MSNITLEGFRAALVQAVEEKGADYVYPASEKTPGGTCVYSTRDGAPSCIVGYGLHNLGLSIPAYDNIFGAATALNFADHSGTDWEGTTLGIAATAAQRMQDNGYTWGEALAAFDYAVESHVADLNYFAADEIAEMVGIPVRNNNF